MSTYPLLSRVAFALYRNTAAVGRLLRWTATLHRGSVSAQPPRHRAVLDSQKIIYDIH